MNDRPPRKLGFADFLHDLRHAHPLFWVGAAIVVAIFLLRWLTGQP